MEFGAILQKPEYDFIHSENISVTVFCSWGLAKAMLIGLITKTAIL